MQPDTFELTEQGVKLNGSDGSKGGVTGYKHPFTTPTEGGFPHYFVKWWAAQQASGNDKTLLKEVSALGVFFWHKTSIFDATKSHMKSTKPKLGRKMKASEAGVYELFTEQYSDSYVLMSLILILMDQCASAPPDVLKHDLFEPLSVESNYRLPLWYPQEFIDGLGRLGEKHSLRGWTEGAHTLPLEAMVGLAPTIVTLLTMEPHPVAELDDEEEASGIGTGGAPSSATRKRSRAADTAEGGAAGTEGGAAASTAGAAAAMEEDAADGAASGGGGGEDEPAAAAQAAVASEPELSGEPELFGLRESFVSLCLAHYQRQGVHGHALLQKLLGAMSALIEQSQSSRLGWLRTHFLDVVVQRIEPVQPLPPVEKNSPEYGRMLESLTKLEDELLAAHDAAHESTLKHEGLLSKVSKKQKEYAAALDELLASEEENEPLKLKVQQLTLEVSRHRQVIDDATDPLPPPPVTQPPITQPPITPSPGTPAAGTSAANLASASGGAGAASSASSASASAVAGGSGELSAGW